MTPSALPDGDTPTGALLLIDVQVSLLDEPKAADAPAVLGRIRRLAERARAGGVPVVWVRHDGEPGSGLVPDSPGWRLHPDAGHRPGDRVVGKTTNDAFADTSLDVTLRRLDVRRLFVAGYASELCVDATLRRALASGYDVTLVADAHTTKDRAVLPAQLIRAHVNSTVDALLYPGRRHDARPTDACLRELAPA